jgi:hypothetical protein
MYNGLPPNFFLPWMQIAIVLAFEPYTLKPQTLKILAHKGKKWQINSIASSCTSFG